MTPPESISADTVKIRKRGGPIRRVWRRFIEPPDSVQTVEGRRHLRLLSPLLATLALLTSAGIVYVTLTDSSLNLSIALPICLVVVFTVSFVLSRTHLYRLAIALTVWSIAALPIASFVAGGDYSEAHTVSSLMWIFVALLLATLFYSVRGILSVWAGIMVALGSLIALVPDVTFASLFPILALYFVLGSLTLLNKRHRDLLERDRRQELAGANRELQALGTVLESRIAERTRDLEFAAEVGRSISELRDLDELMADAAERIRDRFSLYYTQIYLVDGTGRNLQLRAGTGPIGRKLLDRGLSLPIDTSSVNGSAALTRQAVLISDVLTDAMSDPVVRKIFQSNPLLPDTRSELAIPLLAGEHLLGVLDLQSSQRRSLNQENLPAFEALAGHLAVAIENAELFTERKRTRAELVMFRLGIERSPNAVFLTDVDGVILYVNGAFEKMYGYSRAEAMGQTPRILKSGRLSEEEYEQFWKTLLAKEVVASEIVNRTKDGRFIFVDGSNNPILDGDGEIIGFLGLHIDITERKRAEEELQLLGRVAEQSLDGLLVTDLEGHVEFVNRAWAQMHGYEPDDLREEAISFFHTEEQMKAEVLPFNAQAVRTGAHQGEISHVHRNGSIFATWTTLSVLKDAAGDPTRLVITAQDISERKKSAETLAKRAIELEAVAEVSTAVASQTQPRQLLRTAADLTKTSFKLYHAHIYLLDEHSNELVLTAGAGELGRRMVKEGRRIAVGRERSIVSRAARALVGVIVNDVKADPGFLPHPLLPETQSELAVPMLIGDRLLGVLDLQSENINQFTNDDVNIQTTLATQIAVALQNASQYEQMQITLEELSTLQRAMSRSGWQAFMTSSERPILGFLASQQELSSITRNGSSTSDSDAPAVHIASLTEEQSSNILPMSVRGRTIGGLGIRPQPGTALSTENRMLLESISQQVAGALERARLSEQTEQALSQTEDQAERLVYLNELGSALNKAGDEFSIYKIATESTYRIMPLADRVSVALMRAEDETFDVLALNEGGGELIPEGHRVPLKGRMIGRVIAEARTINTKDIRESELLDFQSLAETGLRSILTAPLVAAGRIIGTLNVGSRRIGAFGENDEHLLQQIVALLASAVENRRLMDQIQQRAALRAALNDASLSILSQTHPQEVYQVTTKALVEKFDMSLAQVWTIDFAAENLRLQASEGVGPPPVQSVSLDSTEMLAWVAKRRKSHVTNDLANNPRADHKQWVAESGAVAFAGYPLLAGKELLGVLSMYSQEPIDGQTMLLLQSLAVEVSTVVNTLQLFGQTKRRATQLETVAKVSATISTTLETERLLQDVVDLTKSSFDLYHVHAYLLDEEELTLVLSAGAGQVGKQMVSEGRSILLRQEQSLVARSARSRKPVVVNDVSRDTGFLPHRLLPETRSEMAIPLIASGQVLGVLDVQASERNQFTDEDIHILTTLASQVAVAIQNARLFEDTQQAGYLLGERVKELNCLNDIGRKMEETPPLPEFLQWVVERIPAAMPYPNECTVALRLGEEVYGAAEAMEMPSKVVHELRVGRETVGHICVAYPMEREALGEENMLLLGIVRRISNYVESQRLFEQTQRQLTDLASIQRTTSRLTAALTFNEAVQTLLPQIADAVEASNVSLFLVDGEEYLRRAGSFPTSAGTKDGAAAESEQIPLSQFPLMHEVLESRQAMTVATNDSRLQPHARESFEQAGIHANAQIPMMTRDKVFGLLSVSLNRPGQVFEEHDMALLQTLADQAMIAIERVRLLEETRKKARNEQLLREITTRVSGSADVDMVMRTAVEEIGRALGRRAFVYLGSKKKMLKEEVKNGA